MQSSKFKAQRENFKKHEPKYENDLKIISYQFALRVIRLLDILPKNMSSDVVGRQLLRSASSIGANIVEARAASSKKDFINFFTYALKSANETIYWINLLRDSGKVSQSDMSAVIAESDRIARLLGASIVTLKKNLNNS